MILFAAFVGAFVATLAYPGQTVTATEWVLGHFGYIVAASAVLDALILLGIVRWRARAQRADR